MRLIGELVGLVVAGAENRLAIVHGFDVPARQKDKESVSDQDADGDEIDERPGHAVTASATERRRLGLAGVIPKKSLGVTSPPVVSEISLINSGEGMRPAMNRVTVGCSHPILSAKSR